MLRRILFLCTLLFSLLLLGQNEQNKVALSKALQNIQLKVPENIERKYTYNPILNKYIYTEKINKTDILTPLILTPKEYEELILKQQMRAYLREKYELARPVDDDADSTQKKKKNNLLPEFYVNSEFFETVFGSNVIEVIPKGSFSVDLGGRYNYIDNPVLPLQYRRRIGIDFNQNINIGLMAKIGTRVQMKAQYNTNFSFDFQNLFKLDYEPTEDAIVRKVEFGNVSLPLSGSLIQGAQSLFGAKTKLQFGRTTITGIISEQRSQNRRLVAQSGGTLTNFEISALDYDDNRNYFLSHFFRDRYNEALKNYPYIRSKVRITRIEVWVTNRNRMYENVRNIVALQDLAEPNPENTKLNQNAPVGFFSSTPYMMPSNAANRYNPDEIDKTGVLTSQIRDIATVKKGFGALSSQVKEGFDYAVIENARKLEEGRDFKVDRKLGYISLAQRLNDDEVLAVAYQYTYQDKQYQVGEFANDGISTQSFSWGNTENAITRNALVLKLLKSSRVNTQQPMWNLMMKNVYSVNTLRLSPEDFRMHIFYVDPSPVNYLPVVDESTFPVDIKGKSLLQVFHMDNLNRYNDPQPGGDGFFDFVDGITVDAQYGKIIFPEVEPFGKYLFDKLGGGQYDDPSTYNANQKKYVYRSLYTDTKPRAQEDASKNKFQIKGRYKSEKSQGISLGAFNVPKGSVRIYVGGRLLQEGIDYTVNYQLGTVQILDPSVEASNLPIEVSVENNLIFNQQSRIFSGVNIEHKFNDNFVLGSTVINMRERPLTQKAKYGAEPVSNTILGFNGNYSTELPFLTRWVNRLPTIKSDVKSNLSIRGELAYLWAGTPKADNFEGEATSYLEDFESSQAIIDIRSWQSWSMASTPLEFGKVKNTQLYGDTPQDVQNLKNGYGRSKIAWYSIDPIFYTSQRPSDVTTEELSKNSRRRIYVDEIFPQADVAQGESLVQTTLDLAYFPQYKGPYNNNPDFQNQTSDQKWGGIMKPLSTTNFESANIEYLQFWLLDPYSDGEFQSNGTLVFNLGYISEDILKDGRKQYENGLPGVNQPSLVSDVSWGKVPVAQSIAYAFDINPENRAVQDVGLDGISDDQERSIYTNNVSFSPSDPALDNFSHYLNRSGDILNRYMNFNGLEGNSPVATTNARGSSTQPDVEDLNNDNAMNTMDSYFEYRIAIHSGISRADAYVNDIRETEVETLSGKKVRSRWIQYKIPIKSGTSIGGITDFRSIPFARIYLTNFSSPIVLRFGTLELLRGDWRVYSKKIGSSDNNISQGDTSFEVGSVNTVENETRQPIPYVMPPNVERELINNNNTLVRQNEQALSLSVCNLKPTDARAVYKNINADLRQYKFLKMFVHAEAKNDMALGSGEMIAFIRIGTDFDQNYYEIQIPLQITSPGATSAQDIWPLLNQLEVPLQNLTKLKSEAIVANVLTQETYYNSNLERIVAEAPYEMGKNRYVIKGNPSLGNVRALMLGVRNASKHSNCAEVWFNELRLAQLENNGGWAAVGAVDLNAADLLNVSATGKISTVGFGSLEQTSNERSKENMRQHNLMMNINAGKLLPPSWNLQIPVNVSHSEKVSSPEYDPVYQDIKLNDRLDAASTQQQKQEILSQAQDFTTTRGINLVGVKKTLSQGQKSHFYNIENLTLNYGYNETYHRDFEIEKEYERRLKLAAVYAYGFTPNYHAPLKRIKFLSNKKYLQWLSDVNFNFLPSSISFGSNIQRNFTQQKFRSVFFEGISTEDQQQMPEYQYRNFRTNWQYGINYNPMRSLRLSFKGNNDRIVRRYNQNNVSQQWYQDSLWEDIWDIGDTYHFTSNFQLNYELPFSKIPLMRFVKTTYTYEGSFDWMRGSQALAEQAGEQINTIQNSASHNIIAQLSFDQIYRDLKIQGTKNTWLQLLMMVKRISGNYTQTGGMVLPGFTPDVGFWGVGKPSPEFVLGDQRDIRYDLARKGMLTTFDDLNEPFSQVKQSKLHFTANIQPVRDFQIDLNANRQYTSSYNETFVVNASESGQYEYQKWAGNQVGSFSISTNMIATTFSASSEQASQTFEKFKENRKVIAYRLAQNRGIDISNASNLDTEGYPKGYGSTNQSVLIPAFLSAYTGKSASTVSLDAFRNIPIPSWTIRYTGLMRMEYFRERFRRFSLSHGYRSTYTITDFRTNLDYDATNPNALDKGDNFRNEKLFGTINLIEQFSPLIKLDFEMKNAVSALLELRRDRTVSISLDNDYLTEILRKEYRLGLGYRIKDLRFVINWLEEKQTLKSDLILKASMSYRKDFTVIRNMKINSHQLTAGQEAWQANLSAEYALSDHLSALYYLDYNFSKTLISTSFPYTTFRTGFTARYSF